MRLRHGAAALLLASAVTTTAMPATAGLGEEFTARTPVQSAGLPDLDRIDPARYSYDDAIVEHAQVPSRDGVNQIWVDLIRPNTPEGVKVPTILMASPYFNTLGRGYKGDCKTPHQSPPGGLAGSPGCDTAHRTPFPEWYDEYFVPRGYAFAAMDLRGTRNTSGCQAYGDRDEVFDAVDVVDWIAEQPWSNGKVGMTGGSYDGTIANGAAAEAPISGKHKDALAAIIPIRAIDRWYDYHFFNGVQSSAHAATPAAFTALYAGQDLQNSGTDDLLFPAHVVERKACIATVGVIVDAGYTSPYQDASMPFWAERDFVKDAAGIRAAVFLIHGLFDFNVKMNNAGHLWEALPPKLPKKLWLINADHIDPRCHDDEACAGGGHIMPFPAPDRFVEWNHRWWLQFLKGVEAGALAGPTVEAQRYDGRWDGADRYPASTSDLVLHLNPDQAAAARPAGEPGQVSWRDNAASQAPAKQAFVTEPFTTATRVSGQFQFDLTYTATGVDTTIAVQVDSLPPDAAVEDPADDNLYDGEDDAPLLVTYGWLRALYRNSIKPRGLSVPVRGDPLVPAQATTSSFPSLYTDFVVKAGHRLRFTFSNQAGGTVPSLASESVALTTVTSTVRVPVAPMTGSVTKPPVTRPPVGPPVVKPPAPKPPAGKPLPATGGFPALPVALAAAGAALALGRVRRSHPD